MYFLLRNLTHGYISLLGFREMEVDVMKKFLGVLCVLVSMNYCLSLVHGAIAWMKVPSELKQWQSAEPEVVCIKDCSFKAIYAEYIEPHKNEDGQMIPAENVVHFEVRWTETDAYGGNIYGTLTFYDSEGNELSHLDCYGLCDSGKNVPVTLTGTAKLQDVRKKISKASISHACKD